MPGDTEIELKFQVPASSRAALVDELGRGRRPVERLTLAARYLDTPDRRLARKGLAWRMRREGRRWVQTLKAPGAGPMERFEHEAVLVAPSHDAALHAGSPAGGLLLQLLEHARKDGSEVGVRFETQVRRTTRCLRTRGAVVEVSLDEGRLIAAGRSERIREVEFEFVSGSPGAMLALAERWRRKFDLVYDPRSKAERGDRLADGSPHPPVRKARPLRWTHDATAAEAFGAVVDECLAHISRNAIGLVDGAAEQRVEHVHQMRVGIRRLRSALRTFREWAEHVHQMRVGIRRLRSALRTFRDWAQPPPPELVDTLRRVFTALGQAREADVLGAGVVAELAQAGAPPLALRPGTTGPDPAAVVRASGTQQLLLAWIGWRASLDALPPATGVHPVIAKPADGSSGDAEACAQAPTAPPAVDPAALRRRAHKRLQRWHRALEGDCARFEQLDEAALHALRKRIKRQRYAVEFLAPALRGRDVKRYLEALATIQERMGELNDLFVARGQYQAMVEQEPGAWFALGWLAARTQQVRTLAKPELERAMKVDPPRARR